MAMALAAAGAGFAAPASAQPADDFPNRPITIVVPYSPGGATDIITRAAARGMSTLLKQPVMVVNRPGAAGQIGAEFVAKSRPDGYTLLAFPENIYSINPFVYGAEAAEVAKNLVPVSNLGGSPTAIAIGTSGPMKDVKSFAELIDYARKSRAPITYATSGVTTPYYLLGTEIARQAGIELVHVPYKGTSEAVPDLVGGRVDILIGAIAVMQPMADAGKLRMLVVTSTERFPMTPDLPSLSETMPGVVLEHIDNGLAAPRGTPDAVIGKINAAANQVLATPEMLETLQKNMLLPMPGGVAEYTKRVERTRDRREKLIREANIEQMALPK